MISRYCSRLLPRPASFYTALCMMHYCTIVTTGDTLDKEQQPGPLPTALDLVLQVHTNHCNRLQPLQSLNYKQAFSAVVASVSAACTRHMHKSWCSSYCSTLLLRAATVLTMSYGTAPLASTSEQYCSLMLSLLLTLLLLLLLCMCTYCRMLRESWTD
jgi:hypothetical protein